MKGLFITLEGGDGAGKSTQAGNIESFFRKKGLVVVRTREPGGTGIGEKLRKILLDRASSGMTPLTEMFIYAAARAQHVRELIVPALERGEIVISDRFTDSSIAYQGYGRMLGNVVADVNEKATGGLVPDITFWFDIDPEAGRKRVAAAGEPDRLEMEEAAFYRRMYEGYKALAADNPCRIKRIDASATKEEICSEIYACLEKLCEERGIQGSGTDNE